MRITIFRDPEGVLTEYEAWHEVLYSCRNGGYCGSAAISSLYLWDNIHSSTEQDMQIRWFGPPSARPNRRDSCRKVRGIIAELEARGAK